MGGSCWCFGGVVGRGLAVGRVRRQGEDVLALISDGLAWADRDEGSGKLANKAAISHVNRHNALPTHDCSAGHCNPRGHLPFSDSS